MMQNNGDDLRWQQVVARDTSADDRFVYAVESTGIYCRPSCGAKRPQRERVSFYSSWQAAEKAGYRACRRCRPNQPSAKQQQTQRLAAVCDYIDAQSHIPTLAELAQQFSLSPYYLQRLFKQQIGVTPKVYAEAARQRRVKAALHNETTITEAIYDAGYASSSRFYEKSHALIGMTPTRYRLGGAEQRIDFVLSDSPLGCLLVALTAKGVCHVALGQEPLALLGELRRTFPRASLQPGGQTASLTLQTLVELIQSPAKTVDLPLDIQGTAFQQRVWQALRKIPLGTTVTYQQVAQSLGLPKGSRAVANACAANTIALLIPCHRVVRQDGGLAGYRWGETRKAALLAREYYAAQQQTKEPSDG